MLVSAFFSFNFDVVTFGKTSKFIVGVIKIKGIAFAARARACTKKTSKRHPENSGKRSENQHKSEKKTSRTTLPQTAPKKNIKIAPKRCPRVSQRRPKSSRTLPWRHQNGSHGPLERPKGAPRTPQRAPRRLRGPPDPHFHVFF